MNSFEVQLLAIIHVCALCDLCAKESFLKKAFCLVHTRKQGAIKPISLFYVNALNASFTMAYFLEGEMAFGSGVGLVVACEQVLQ